MAQQEAKPQAKKLEAKIAANNAKAEDHDLVEEFIQLAQKNPALQKFFNIFGNDETTRQCVRDCLEVIGVSPGEKVQLPASALGDSIILVGKGTIEMKTTLPIKETPQVLPKVIFFESKTAGRVLFVSGMTSQLSSEKNSNSSSSSSSSSSWCGWCNKKESKKKVSPDDNVQVEEIGEVTVVLSKSDALIAVVNLDVIVSLSKEKLNIYESFLCQFPGLRELLLMKRIGMAITFDQLLCSPLARKNYTSYLNRNYAGDQVEAIGSMVDYKLRHGSRTEEENAALAKNIMDNYIGPNAAKVQVNIPGDMVDQLEQNFAELSESSAALQDTFFDICYQEIKLTVLQAGFEKYKQSEDFSKLLTKIKHVSNIGELRPKVNT